MIRDYSSSSVWLGRAERLFAAAQSLVEGEASFMANYLELPVGDRCPEVFRVVVEIPNGY